jgi:putative heme-binding domain-containing protein
MTSLRVMLRDRLRATLQLCASGIVGFCCAACSVASAADQADLRPKSPEDYRRFAMIHEGDPARGKNLFADEQRVACSRCHSVDGTAAKAGPDLFAVGDKFARQEIIDSILKPSETIETGYSTTTVETMSGEEFSGIIKQANGSWLELADANGKRVRILKAEIRRQQTSEISLMPQGLETGLSLAEFADLIEYLVGLKQPASAVQVAHGMPASIESLARPVDLQPFHSEQLHFEHPVWFGQIPGRPAAFLVVEHETGNIWCLDKSAGDETKTLFVALEPYMKGTRGLIGFAFHPRFRQNRKYYYAKHLVENGDFHTYIFERVAAADGRSDSGRPPRRIIKFDNVTNVHYGGGLQFGPDGYLYIGMGDTGPQEDPAGHGQDTTLLLGKMLRIDVDHGTGEQGYAVPPDNPFVSHARPIFTGAGSSASDATPEPQTDLRAADVRPEIWAVGFREPWRFSFDSLTGDLWVGDVGQDRYEEVDLVRRGENYGWNVFEGFEPFSNRYRRPAITYVPPVFAYGRKFGVCVTGGSATKRSASGENPANWLGPAARRLLWHG